MAPCCAAGVAAGFAEPLDDEDDVPVLV